MDNGDEGGDIELYYDETELDMDEVDTGSSNYHTTGTLRFTDSSNLYDEAIRPTCSMPPISTNNSSAVLVKTPYVDLKPEVYDAKSATPALIAARSIAEDCTSGHESGQVVQHFPAAGLDDGRMDIEPEELQTIEQQISGIRQHKGGVEVNAHSSPSTNGESDHEEEKSDDQESSSENSEGDTSDSEGSTSDSSSTSSSDNESDTEQQSNKEKEINLSEARKPSRRQREVSDSSPRRHENHSPVVVRHDYSDIERRGPKKRTLCKDNKRLSAFFEQARYFLIKSGNSANVKLSKAKGVWATTPRNERMLNKAFHETRNVILVFSIERSQAFQGFCRLVAESSHTLSPVNWELPPGMSSARLGGVFRVQWISRCELPFRKTTHLVNRLNENQPVKVGRDGTEISPNAGRDLCDLFPADDSVEIDLRKLRASRNSHRTSQSLASHVETRRRGTSGSGGSKSTPSKPPAIVSSVVRRPAVPTRAVRGPRTPPMPPPSSPPRRRGVVSPVHLVRPIANSPEYSRRERQRRRQQDYTQHFMPPLSAANREPNFGSMNYFDLKYGMDLFLSDAVSMGAGLLTRSRPPPMPLFPTGGGGLDFCGGGGYGDTRYQEPMYERSYDPRCSFLQRTVSDEARRVLSRNERDVQRDRSHPRREQSRSERHRQPIDRRGSGSVRDRGLHRSSAKYQQHRGDERNRRH